MATLSLVLMITLLTWQSPQAVGDVNALARTVLQELAAREFEKVAARFDQKMAAVMPAVKLAATWDLITGQLGPFKEVTAVTVEGVGAHQRANVAATFDNAVATVQFVFDNSAKIAGFAVKPAAATAAWTPPAYALPDAFDERELTIGDRFKLPATMTVPRGEGPFPAVVLVHGSGPNDRDETLGPNKIFKDLAWGLASRGIAVLRYEKRTRAMPAEAMQIKGFTSRDEVTDDVREAVTAVVGSAGVDATRVFVAGHSLGGTLAPRVGAEDRRVAGLIVLAGATRALEEALLDQVRYLQLDQATTASVERTVQHIRSPELRPDDTVEFLGSRTPGSYWLDLRAYRPADVAAALTVPMLVLQGQRDYQVTAADFEGWRRALTARPNVTFKRYPTLNHLFIDGTGPSRPEEYARPGHVAEEVVRDIAAFVLSR